MKKGDIVVHSGYLEIIDRIDSNDDNRIYFQSVSWHGKNNKDVRLATLEEKIDYLVKKKISEVGS